MKAKESIRKIQGFVNEHDVSRYVIREEEKSRILDTQTNEYLLLNGVPMEWENRKDAERFLREMEGAESMKKTETETNVEQEQQVAYRVDTKEQYLKEIRNQIRDLQKEEKEVVPRL